jgi:hypothetical protein
MIFYLDIKEIVNWNLFIGHTGFWINYFIYFIISFKNFIIRFFSSVYC